MTLAAKRQSGKRPDADLQYISTRAWAWGFVLLGAELDLES